MPQPIFSPHALLSQSTIIPSLVVTGPQIKQKHGETGAPSLYLAPCSFVSEYHHTKFSGNWTTNKAETRWGKKCPQPIFSPHALLSQSTTIPSLVVTGLQIKQKHGGGKGAPSLYLASMLFCLRVPSYQVQW